MTNKFCVLSLAFCVLSFLPKPATADSYDSLLKRYEKQIHQQERQMKRLRASLDEKERDVLRWQKRAEDAKTAWSDARTTLEKTREKISLVHEKRQASKLLADAALWKSAENVMIARSALAQARALAQDLYIRDLVPEPSARATIEGAAPEWVFAQIDRLSVTSEKMAEEARREEASLRTEEMRWEKDEFARSQEADRLHQKQQSQWLKWQDALRRKTALQDEISQIDQSAKALQVMLDELCEHRDQARALRDNRPGDDQALASLRGTLPWPAQGKVVQGYGRQYPDGTNQLVVSNGIKIDAGTGHTVRAIQEGKVLFASPFRQYGQLVIIQHKSGLTSVYAGLGETQVKPEEDLKALDPIGRTGESGSFYFELRRDEQPMNPLAYLQPVTPSELSSRRTFQ
jgi:septal ring factor EnvC (AmiA/AmiB activator)